MSDSNFPKPTFQKKTIEAEKIRDLSSNIRYTKERIVAKAKLQKIAESNGYSEICKAKQGEHGEVHNEKFQTPKYYLPRKEIPIPIDSDECDNAENCPLDFDRNMKIDWSDSESSDIEEDGCDGSNGDYCEQAPYRHFHPKLYDFVLDDYDDIKDLLIQNERKFKDNVVIRCPEYPILLDHAIAVIWFFYRDWKNWNNFNIPQLEWAIKFVSGIFANDTHDSFADVEIIRDHLEELLYINYTEVEDCVISENTLECPKEIPKKKIELPQSLKALFYRAPGFTNYLSMEPSCRQTDAMQLDEYANVRIQLMSDQLDKLRGYEMRYTQSLAEDAELHYIIDALRENADEVVKARKEAKRLRRPSN